MELTNEQINILQIIHDSENHGINENEISILKIDFPQIDYELQKFIEKDLVEYELRENKYYLAYEGFERLESRVKTVRQRTDTEQYREIVDSFGGAKRFQRIILLGVFIITIFAAILLYLNPEIANYNKQKDFNIDESTLNQIKIQLQEKLDSIQDSNNSERIDLQINEN